MSPGSELAFLTVWPGGGARVSIGASGETEDSELLKRQRGGNASSAAGLEVVFILPCV